MKRVVVVTLLACACGPAAAPYQPRVVESGQGWWCTVDPSGAASGCERSEERCAMTARSMAHQLGAGASFSDCALQPIAYCFGEAVAAGEPVQFVDRCHIDEHSCELARSRTIQFSPRPGLHLTACGKSP